MARKVTISYDRDVDVTYLLFENRAAEAEEIEDGVFARCDPKTGKLVGFTIRNFSKKFTKKPRDRYPQGPNQVQAAGES